MPGSPMRSLHMCSGSAACCRAAPLSGHRCVEATRSTLACQMPAQGLPARNFTLALRTAAWHMYLVTGKLAAVVCQQHEGKGLSGAGSGCGVASVHTPQQSAGNASILHATCTGCTEQDKHGFLGEPARICVWAIANVRLNICITGYLAAAKKRIAATPYPTNLHARAHLCTPHMCQRALALHMRNGVLHCTRPQCAHLRFASAKPHFAVDVGLPMQADRLMLTTSQSQH